MRILSRLFVFALALSSPIFAAAQAYYQRDTSIPVFAYGQQQTLAWCGGFNNPQFGMADLNHDGLDDLVVFENWNSLRTFINTGTAGAPNYRYAPEYALNFPPIYDYMILADYNCDGIADLFEQGASGFAAYKGYYNSYNQLCFTFYQDLFYNNDSRTRGAYVNAFNNPGDIPSIVDVDGDGDLDFIAYNIVGGNMNLYKNMRVELGLPCDSIHVELKDNCWGKVYQGFYRTHTLAYSCDNSMLRRAHDSSRVTHTGNTPCLFDWDMDGDYDYLDGSVSYNEMTFLKNGRIEAGSGPDSMISQDTLWQSGGTQIEIPSWPAAFNVDVDVDGKKDLLISPNGGLTSENYNCIWYYKNYSTTGHPDWRFQSDSFLTDKTIDLGTAANPMLFDYNKDGMLDLFVGSDGYRQPDGTMQSRLSYYKNTGTWGSPVLTLQTSDFMGLSAFNFQGAVPATGDIDYDGKSDLIIGHNDGTLSYFKNMAASDVVAPAWTLVQLVLTDEDGDTINTGGNAAPFIYDMDRDGKKDLLIGDIYGNLEYYQNVSTTAGTIKLKLINLDLGNARSDPRQFFGNYSTPFIGRIDTTGTDYLLMGSSSGNIYRYTGFQTGDTTATYTLLDEQYAYIDSVYNQYNHLGAAYGIYGNIRSSVTVGDIGGDGSYEMIVGNERGGLELYKLKARSTLQASFVNEHAMVQLFPNPASDLLNVSWSGVLQPMVQIAFINMEGQQLYGTSMPSALNFASLSVSMLPPGMYVCQVQSGVNRYYSKFTVIR